MKKDLILLILVFVFVMGCTTEEESNIEKILILADGFKEGETIPVENTCDGKDKSPALSLKGVPEGTKSIALIMDDPDASGGAFTHWLIYNIPPETRMLPESVPQSKNVSDGSMQGINDFVSPGYGGPCPPPGKPHRYYFRVYALDTLLSIEAGASKSRVENAMRNHILAKGELMGIYKR